MAEVVAGPENDRGLPALGDELARRGRALERAPHAGAHRDDAPAALLGSAHLHRYSPVDRHASRRTLCRDGATRSACQ